MPFVWLDVRDVLELGFCLVLGLFSGCGLFSFLGKTFDVAVCIVLYFILFCFILFYSLGLFWVGGRLQDLSEIVCVVLYLSVFTDGTYLWLA